MENKAAANSFEEKMFHIIRAFHVAGRCTDCGECSRVCPQGIPIPDLFACMNTKKQFHDWNSDNYYHDVHTKNAAKASDCLKCGQCEDICPQHLNIRDLLEDVAKVFEK